MSWICSNTMNNNHNFSPAQFFYEYRTIDPKSRQIYHQLLSINSQDHQKYKDWRRIKIESIDVKKLMNFLKDKKQHFLDPSFPHSNGVLSKDHFKQKIEWVRIKDLIQYPVYSKEQTIKTLQKVKLNRVQFQKALVLIARSSPTLFKEILTKTLNSEGIYDFKLFRNGYIRNIVVDDYIPVHQGQPIFVGPVRQNQVYPMLLEKAIAKACQSYQNIPYDCEQIMEMIFCGPVKKFQLQKLKEKKILTQTIENAIKKKHLSVIISKKESRLKNYGLNENQIYNLLNCHHIKIDQQQQIVYELMSESKVSAWNGKFSLNHQIWDQIQLNKKIEYYQQIKNNKSFLIPESDIPKLFQQLLIFQSLDMKNKQWIENVSDNNFPSFTQFEVFSDDTIFLRITTSSKIRHCIILVKQTAPKVYEFISSTFNQSTYKSQISIGLGKGKYILAVYHQWFLHNTGNYYVFISSAQHINLKKGGILDGQFLTKTLINYEEQLTKIDKVEPKIYTMRLKVYEIGLAWLFLKPQESKTKSLTITIDQQQLISDLENQVTKTEVKSIIVNNQKPLSSRIIILKKSQVQYQKKQYFPVGAFTLKQ